MAAKSKTWYASKTIWLNTITALIAVATTLQSQSIIAEYPQASAAIVATLAVLNVALRIVSVLPIG